MKRFWRPHEAARLVYIRGDEGTGVWRPFATILPPWKVYHRLRPDNQYDYDVDVEQDPQDRTRFHFEVTPRVQHVRRLLSERPRLRDMFDNGSFVQNEDQLCRAWGGIVLAIRAANAKSSTAIDVVLVDRNSQTLLYEKRRPEHAPLDIPMPMYESLVLAAGALELWQREWPFSGQASLVLYDAARDFLSATTTEKHVLECAELVPLDEMTAILAMAEEGKPTWETTSMMTEST